MSLDQQFGLLHRLRAKADEGEDDQVSGLLESFRLRDDLFASVATELDALQKSLASEAGKKGRPHPLRAWLRSPLTSIDWVAIALVGAAVITTLAAMSGNAWEIANNGPRPWGSEGSGQRWQLGGFVGAFLVAVIASFSKVRSVQKVASAAALGISLIGLYAWWWRGGIQPLLLETHIPSESGSIKLGTGMTGSGLSLGLQVLAGTLLIARAFSAPTHLSGPHRRVVGR
jgi:hypothetical protein